MMADSAAPTLYAEAKKAATALKKLPRKKSINQLFGAPEEYFELVIALREDTPLPLRENFCYLPLKHRIWDDDVEVGFFCREPRGHIKHLCKEAVPMVKKVIGLPRLRKWYNTIKLRTHLMRSFPVFVADRVVYTKLMPLLGRRFWANRHPHPIKLGKHVKPQKLARRVNKALQSTFVIFRELQVTYSPKIGRECFEPEHVADNVVSVMDYLATVLPSGWGDINRVSLKTTMSPAIPIYVGPLRLVAGPTDGSRPPLPFKPAKKLGEEGKVASDTSEEDGEGEPAKKKRKRNRKKKGQPQLEGADAGQPAKHQASP